MIGVEIVEEAVVAARENAERNGIKNCEFIAGDVLKVLDEIEEKPDFIVLDPPRDGIHRKLFQRSSNTRWIIWFIFPVNRPALQGIWKSFYGVAIAWSGAYVSISLHRQFTQKRSVI